MTPVAVAAIAVGALLVALWLRRRWATAAARRDRYAAALGHLPDVSVLLYDADLRFTVVEGPALAAHGWSRVELEGRLAADVIPPDRWAELRPRLEAALAGESSSQEWPGLRDGARYRLEHVPVSEGADGRAEGMIVIRDVTRPERLARAVQEQRGFLAAVFAHLGDEVVACDATGRLQGEDAPDVDPLDWPEHFGLRAPDGRTPLAPAEVPLFRALQGESFSGAEHVVAAGDGGRLRHVVASGRPVRDARGRTIGAVASAVDVTELREAAAALRASEERYRSVVDSVGDTVFQTDLLGRWAFLNESWADWTGVPVQEALGRPATEVVHPADRATHARAFGPLLSGREESVRVRHRYLTADGATRWAEVRARLARDSAGRPLGVAGVIEDVTANHRSRQYDAAEQAVIDVLASAPGIEEGVPALLDALCRHLDWDAAELWTLDRDAAVLRCTDVAGERRDGLAAFEAARATLSFEIGDGLQGQAWARRAPIWVETLHDEPLLPRRELAVAAGLRSALAVPIECGGEVLATLLFFSREQREPDPGLRRLLQAVGAHLAQFLERRRAERALAELARRLESSSPPGRAVSA